MSVSSRALWNVYIVTDSQGYRMRSAGGGGGGGNELAAVLRYGFGSKHLYQMVHNQL